MQRCFVFILMLQFSLQAFSEPNLVEDSGRFVRLGVYFCSFLTGLAGVYALHRSIANTQEDSKLYFSFKNAELVLGIGSGLIGMVGVGKFLMIFDQLPGVVQLVFEGALIPVAIGASTYSLLETGVAYSELKKTNQNVTSYESAALGLNSANLGCELISFGLLMFYVVPRVKNFLDDQHLDNVVAP